MGVKATVVDSYGQAGPTTPVGGWGTLCLCGNGYAGQAHLCLKWNAKMTPETMAVFQKAILDAGIDIGGEAVVGVDMSAQATRDYLRNLLTPHQNVHVVLIEEAVLTMWKPLHDDDGRRYTFTLQKVNDLSGDLVVHTEDDPQWVKDFTARHKEKVSAMPICCDNPDPRIAKNNRPYCHNCKKYLDRVPPPQLPRPVPEPEAKP